MVKLVKYSGADGFGAGGAPSAAAAGLSLADLVPYHREKLIYLQEFETTASGIELSNIFTEEQANSGNEYVVRFRVGGIYTSTNYLRLQYQINGGFVTTGYWDKMDGFQQSTSAYQSSQTNDSSQLLCRGSSYPVWEGEFVFPTLDMSQVETATTYPLGMTWEVYHMSRNSGGQRHTFGVGGVQNQHGNKITGFSLFDSVMGNASYQIGKPSWMGLPAYVAIYERMRALK